MYNKSYRLPNGTVYIVNSTPHICSTYKQVQSFTDLGSTMTETPDMSAEIDRRTRACWMRIRRYLRVLYDQLKATLSLKTRMVKGRGNRGPLYGCSTWTLYQKHYSKLGTAHHRVLLRIIGAQRKRPDHRMTLYNRALEITRVRAVRQHCAREDFRGRGRSSE